MYASKYTVFLSILVSISLLGCGHVTEYRYLDEIASSGEQDIYEYENGHDILRRGKELDKVWSHPDFNIGKYHEIYITPMEIAPGLIDGEQSSQLASYFTKTLQDEIKRRLLLRIITAKEGPLPQKALILEISLTKLDRSSKFKNWPALLIGIYPLDPTHVQVEGRIKDANTGKTLFIFADNRAGGPLFSGDEETWQRHVADVASDLVLELAAARPKLVR
ncbi:MAG: DUF3313 family protein [Candidatus Brocadiales bacterium]